MALSATRGASLCRGQEQAEVDGASGAMLTSATWKAGLGEQRTQEKNIQELQGKEKLLVQNSTLPQAIVVAVLQQSLAELWGWGYAQILPVREWDCWGKKRDWDALVTSAAKHRTQQRKRKTPRDMLGRAGGCKSPQMGSKQIAMQHNDL